MAPLKDQEQWMKSAKALEECLVLIAIRFTAYATVEGRNVLEASARGLTFAMADVFAGALLCEHAAWSEAKTRASGSDAIMASAAKVDRISAQRWCEQLDRRVDQLIQSLGNEDRYEQDKEMLFGLADARAHPAQQASPVSSQTYGEAKL